MRQESIIEVQNLSKVFKIPHEKISTMKQHFVSIFDTKSFEKFNALDNVSFDVKKGEFFGIIGSNGSGKSTLLKILAQIYQPTSGSISIKGTLSPFIELGVGFNPELTARENIFLNAAILGLTKKQTEEKFEEMLKFSELEEFVDQKLKNFSSGMQVRLAFSIAVQAHADILLVDEVLAVGDAAFQQKCLELFRNLKKEGKTIVFVSHALNIVEEFCDRVIFIDKGKANYIGNTQEAVFRYLKTTSEQASKGESGFKKSDKETQTKIVGITFLDSKSKVKTVFKTGEKIVLRISYHTNEIIKDPVFGIAIYTESGLNISGPNTKTSGYNIKKISGKGYVDYVLENLPLLAGTYWITAGIFNFTVTHIYDYVNKGAKFTVMPSLPNQNGLLKFEERWEFYDERS